MSKSFKEGHKYVFTKKKFVQSEGRNWYKIPEMKEWVNECNGREVKTTVSYSGVVRTYGVVPDWCKCVGKEV